MFDLNSIGEISVTSGGKTFLVDPTKMPDESKAKAFVYGVRRIVNDYANAKGNGESNETKAALASDRIVDLYEGKLGSQSRMPTAGDETNIRRKVTLEALSAKERKALPKEADKKAAELDRVWAENEAKLKPMFDAEILRREEKAKAPKVKLSA